VNFIWRQFLKKLGSLDNTTDYGQIAPTVPKKEIKEMTDGNLRHALTTRQQKSMHRDVNWRITPYINFSVLASLITYHFNRKGALKLSKIFSIYQSKY